MTTPMTLPRLAAGRVLMKAPTLDEGGDYEGGERWETVNVAEAHVATSLVQPVLGHVGQTVHAPLLDIDRGYDEGGTFFGNRTRRFDTPIHGERTGRSVYLLNQVLGHVDLGNIFHFGSTVSWTLHGAVDVEFVPSTTEGHGHLYINRRMPERAYWAMLIGFVRLGVLEPGFVRAAMSRGHSAGRLPWIKKGDLVMHSEHVKKPTPLSILEFNAWLAEQGNSLEPDPNLVGL